MFLRSLLHGSESGSEILKVGRSESGNRIESGDGGVSSVATEKGCLLSGAAGIVSLRDVVKVLAALGGKIVQMRIDPADCSLSVGNSHSVDEGNHSGDERA